MAGRGPLPIVAALALVLAAAPAAAQPADPRVDQPADPRTLRFRGSVTLQGEYNDNVFLSERDPRHEFRESLTPSLALRYFTRDLQMTIAYAPSVVHSSLTSEELLLFHAFDGDVRYALTERLTLTLADRFVRTDDPAVSDPRNAFRGRTTVTQNAFTTDLTYRNEPWTLTGRYAFTLNRTEAEQVADAPEERSSVHALGADAAVAILRRTTVGAGYELTLGTFEVGDDFVGHRGRLSVARALDPVTTGDVRAVLAHRDVREGIDFDIYRADVGVRRDVGPRYTVEARAGYARFVPAQGDHEEIPEVLLRGTYTGAAVRITATAGQSFQETFLEALNTGVTRTREAVVVIRYEAGARVILTLDGRVSDNRFLQSVTTGVTTPVTQDREDVLVGGGLEIGVRLSRRTLLTLGYTHTTVDSNQPGFDYRNNRVRLGFTVLYE